MPNLAVRAAAEGMPKINHTTSRRYNPRQIFRAAWKHYRWVRANYAPWQIAQGYINGSFSYALRLTWEHAKDAAKEAALELALTTGPHAGHAAAIRNAIKMLAYKSLRYDVGRMERDLKQQLAQIYA